MSEPAGESPTPPLRIGTAERNAAMAALDTHLEAGRLDAVEYGERSARVVDARTADDLRPLFVDLPAPHPDLPGVGGRVAPAAPAPRPGAEPAVHARSPMEVWGPRLAAVVPFVALALFLTVPIANGWVFFLLIPAAGALVAKSRDHHDERRDARRSLPGERREDPGRS